MIPPIKYKKFLFLFFQYLPFSTLFPEYKNGFTSQAVLDLIISPLNLLSHISTRIQILHFIGRHIGEGNN